MLQSLRKGAASWVAKIFLSLLVVSFAIWGIGDIFRGFGQRNVATVGSTDISTESFRQIYNQRLQALGRQAGRPITPDQARAYGFDRQMLAEVLAEAALDERARQLRLGIGDEELIRRIHDNPSFRGPSGQFDRNLFDQVLRSNGYSELTYIDAERKLALRQQLARAIGGSAEVPHTLASLVDTFRNETRKVEFVTLDRTAAGTIAAPADDVLKAYFEERKAAFRAPEYRKVVVLPVTVETLSKAVEVTDADVRAYFDAHRDRFGAPEQRTLQQIVFPTADEAKAASAKIAGGESFESVAAARGLKPADIELGTVTRAGILDPTVAEAAFALAEGTVSQPIQGRFGHVLVRALKVQPAQSKPFEEVSGQIRQQIAGERAKRELLDRHDKVEDERAAGLTLAEVGAKLGLPVETVEAVDRSGRDMDGKQVPAFPARDEVLEGVFKTELRVENDPVQLGSNGFVWYEVAGITKARDRSFDEAKAQVLARWQEEQAAERVKAKADDLLERLESGQTLETAAKALGLTVSTVAEVRRAGTKELPEAAVAAVFTTAPGTAVSAPGEDAVSRLVIRVVEARTPDASKMPERLQADLRRALEDDLLAQFVTGLEIELGVTVNTRILNQIVGRDAGS
ncbi:SurA N-terminal domain-containing protein [Blastochloris tepida]|uniref:Parvulin-like PPIase n=1 Tax=Blastochloris tepida TaxID=2233851 RepID=A0A348G239_9HYPH|nr:SurA N-terminal domain-containing protein [Blastochloris tepida]BBF93622.1 peptidylprolyl isomerase [Blastochloris tepida]